MMSQVNELIWFCGIWKTIRTCGLKYETVVQEYHNFMYALMIGQQQGFTITIYRLFDADRDTNSFRSLVQGLQVANPSLFQKLQLKLERHTEQLNKYRDLRHNVYGHRNLKVPPADWFRKIKPTQTELEALLKLSQELAAALGSEAGIATEEVILDNFRNIDRDIVYETTAVLHGLKRLNE